MSATRLRGSYLSMIAAWRVIISSTASALRIERNHCASVNSRRRSLLRPRAGERVVMQIDAVDHAARLAHERLPSSCSRRPSDPRRRGMGASRRSRARYVAYRFNSSA